MALLLVILGPISILAAWVYFRLSPKVAARQGLLLYNAGVFLVAGILCSALTVGLYASMSGGPDEGWWPVLSLLGSLLIFTLCLLVGGLIRNLLVFRRRKVAGE